MRLAEEMGLGTGGNYYVADLDGEEPEKVQTSIVEARDRESPIFLVTQDPMGITMGMEQMLLNMGMGLNKGIDRRITVKLSEEMLARTQGD